VAGLDFTRDYVFLVEVLREKSVTTKLDVFSGLPHGFWSFFPKAGFTKDLAEKTEAGFE
jgi:hypothetical protein